MEIEIVTTKKKISATLIRQFKRISLSEITGAECLGYVINIVKDTYKAYIIRLSNGEYRMLEYSWYRYEDSNKIYIRGKKGTAQITFETIDNSRDFIAFLKECDKTQQIFI